MGDSVNDDVPTVAEVRRMRRDEKAKFMQSIETITTGLEAEIDVDTLELHQISLTDFYDEAVRLNNILASEEGLPAEEIDRLQTWAETVDKRYRDTMKEAELYKKTIEAKKKADSVIIGTPRISNSKEVQALELRLLRNKRKLEEELEDSRVAEERRQEDIRRKNRRQQAELEDQLTVARRLNPRTGGSIGLHRTSTPFHTTSAGTRANPELSMTMLRSYESLSTPDNGATTDRWIFEDFKAVGPANECQTMVTMTMISHLKPFGGDPRDWPLFIQSFKSMVHDVFPSDAQRVTLLLSMLDTGLRAGMSQILSTPHAYRAALHELRRKYGHPHLVARAFIQHLSTLEPAKGGDALHLFSTQLHGAVATLDAAGYGHELESTTALESLVVKLPKPTLIRWGRHVTKILPNIPNLRELDLWLEKEVLSDKNIQNFANPSSFCPGRQERQVRSTESNLGRLQMFNPTIAATREKQPNPGGQCKVCNSVPGHGLPTCPKFLAMAPNERAQEAYDLKNCFRCLGRNHFTRECTFRALTCRECSKPHHTLLHGADKVATTRTGGQPNRS